MKAKRTERKDVPPKKAHPLFSLPGHEWRLADDMIGGDFIRKENGWKLVRRKPLLANEKTAEDCLTRADPMVAFVAEKCKFDRKWKQGANALSVIDATATLIRAVLERKSKIEVHNKRRQQAATKPPPSLELIEVNKKVASAVALLLDLAVKSCEHLTALAEEHPELLREIAHEKTEWPVMMSLHPGFGKKHLPFLSNLQLGKNAKKEINQLGRCGTQARARAKRTKEYAEALLDCLHSEWNATNHCIDGKPLKSFQKDTDNWWEAAKMRLRESYPIPEAITELDGLVTAPSRRKRLAHVRADILKKLKESFIALVPRP